MSLADLPDMLTVEEAAEVLRISRGTAYDLARRYLWSGGREGLPVIRLGRSLRVPKAALARLLAGEPQPAQPHLRVVDPTPWPHGRRAV